MATRSTNAEIDRAGEIRSFSGDHSRLRLCARRQQPARGIADWNSQVVILPSSTRTILSHNDSVDGRWATITIVTLPFNASSADRIRSSLALSSALVASSSSKMSGWAARARARQMRCR